MTQAQYDKQEANVNRIKFSLKDTRITPEEAIDALVIDLHFGKNRAIELVDEWGKGIYVPYSVWSKIQVSY